MSADSTTTTAAPPAPTVAAPAVDASEPREIVFGLPEPTPAPPAPAPAAEGTPAPAEATEGEGGEPASQQQERDERGRFKGVQPRIDELTRQRREAEREAAYWRQRATAQGQPGQAPAAQPAAPKPAPDKATFATYDEYVEALADWKAEQKVEAAMRRRDAEQASRAEAQAREATAQTWDQRQAAARQALPDYDQVLDAADVPISQAMQEILLESEHGPRLAYHLAKNPTEAQRIAGLSDRAAAHALGRLEASLAAAAPPPPSSSPSAPAAPPVSSAPPPIKPLGSQSAQAANDPNRMSQAEYEAWRAKQGAWWARR